LQIDNSDEVRFLVFFFFLLLLLLLLLSYSVATHFFNSVDVCVICAAYRTHRCAVDVGVALTRRQRRRVESTGWRNDFFAFIIDVFEVSVVFDARSVCIRYRHVRVVAGRFEAAATAA
jgi:hypothetical protein